MTEFTEVLDQERKGGKIMDTLINEVETILEGEWALEFGAEAPAFYEIKNEGNPTGNPQAGC